MSLLYDDNRELLCKVMPNLASQFRGPLGNVYSAIRRLIEQPAADREKRDKDLSMLYQSYYQMLRLVGNLSEAPTLLDEKPYAVENGDIVLYLRLLCHRVETLAEMCGQRLIFRSEKDNHVVSLNFEAVERMMMNLLSNAMKFSGEGGIITVAFRLLRDMVEISVEDTGPGLDPADQAVLFERYQHPDLMDPAPYGFGLGLPLCRRVAQGHGGTILISGVPYAGTRVSVFLPNKRLEGMGVKEVDEMIFDYTGGFNHTLVELSDALPSRAFLERYLD